MATLYPLLRLTKSKKLKNPNKNIILLHHHLFSSSSYSPPPNNNQNDVVADNNNNPHTTQNPPPFSSFFSQVKSRLKQSAGDAQHRSSGNISQTASFNKLQQTTAQFRPAQTPNNISFSDIRERISQQKSSGGQIIPKPRVKLTAEGTRTGTDTVQGEMKNKTVSFLKWHTHAQLGEKLRELRPKTTTTKEKTVSFSLGELNERLSKLREIEQQEQENNLHLGDSGHIFVDIKESLKKLDEQNTKVGATHRLDILGQLSKTPDFMMSPPKDHLVEKYFHPDNMSSAEKLKIELKKVRDEFKMSESDCGSARVQVAQLTTKLKHLSTALHKKDKHSRKGLQAMVQRRKKLLKYLRRTDWDSYCLLLSKLGLRDNPDYKN